MYYSTHIRSIIRSVHYVFPSCVSTTLPVDWPPLPVEAARHKVAGRPQRQPHGRVGALGRGFGAPVGAHVCCAPLPTHMGQRRVGRGRGEARRWLQGGWLADKRHSVLDVHRVRMVSVGGRGGGLEGRGGSKPGRSLHPSSHQHAPARPPPPKKMLQLPQPPQATTTQKPSAHLASPARPPTHGMTHPWAHGVDHDSRRLQLLGQQLRVLRQQ